MSTDITVSPTAVLEASFTNDILAPVVVCSKAAAEGQVETSKLFPCAPAVLAANVHQVKSKILMTMNQILKAEQE